MLVLVLCSDCSAQICSILDINCYNEQLHYVSSHLATIKFCILLLLVDNIYVSRISKNVQSVLRFRPLHQ